MDPDPTADALYCRKCGYALVGLSENRCPECGQAFDPANPRTFYRSSRRWWQYRWLRRVGIAAIGFVAVLALAFGATWGVLYWQWRAEQSTIAALRYHLCVVTVDPLNRPWEQRVFEMLQKSRLPWHESDGLARWFCEMTERAVCVEFRGTTIHRRDLAQITTLSDLTSLTFARVGLDDDASFADLGQLHNLTNLAFTMVPLSDAVLEQVARLPSLDSLDIRSDEITDAGLAHIGRMTALRSLLLEAPQVTDKGLANLARLPKLEVLAIRSPRITSLADLKDFKNVTNLTLSGCGITDAELAPLRHMPSLTMLDLSGLPLTDAAVEHIMALPAIRMVEIGDTNMSPFAHARIALFLESRDAPGLYPNGATTKPAPQSNATSGDSVE